MAGCVDWCPADLASRVSRVAQVHVDAWVMPSDTQAARVADHAVDLAICWSRPLVWPRTICRRAARG